MKKTQLATFRIDSDSWEEFQRYARMQGKTASALLLGFIDSCLQGDAVGECDRTQSKEEIDAMVSDAVSSKIAWINSTVYEDIHLIQSRLAALEVYIHNLESTDNAQGIDNLESTDNAQGIDNLESTDNAQGIDNLESTDTQGIDGVIQEQEQEQEIHPDAVMVREVLAKYPEVTSKRGRIELLDKLEVRIQGARGKKIKVSMDNIDLFV